MFVKQTIFGVSLHTAKDRVQKLLEGQQLYSQVTTGVLSLSLKLNK